MIELGFLILMCLVYVVDNVACIYVLRHGGNELNPGLKIMEKHLGVNEALWVWKLGSMAWLIYTAPQSLRAMFWTLVMWGFFLVWDVIQVDRIWKSR